jgi:hypothetical protein
MDSITYEDLQKGNMITFDEKKRIFDIELADGRKIENIAFNEAYMIADSIVHVMTNGNSRWQKDMQKKFWKLI